MNAACDAARGAVGWTVSEVPAAATYPLRNELLRSDRTDLALHLPDDDVPGAFHLAASDETGAVVGVASALPAAPEFPAAAPAWRLRQMAVAPALQGAGVGSALFEAVLERVRARGAATLWAESRDTSLSFYIGRGMTAIPERRHSVAGVAYTDAVMAV